MENQAGPEPLNELSLEELRTMLAEAEKKADYKTIHLIAGEAKARDGWDDTDPTYYHLGLDCQKALKNVMTYYG